MINADFQLLIKLLLEINDYETEEDQLAAIERRLVETELDPSCYDFYTLKHSLGVLAKLNLDGREWTEKPKELEEFFSKSL
jgi:hypothetical protein